MSRLESLSYVTKTRMKGYHGGNHQAPAYGNTVEFADFREYMPGDDIRNIDWNLFSRFDKYFIRLFVDERQLHNHIYIDTSASMGGVGAEKGEAALQIAAAMGFLSVQSMDRVSYRLISEDKAVSGTGTITGKDALFHSLHLLADTRFQGNADIRSAILHHPEPGYDDGLTIIISDFLTENDWKKAVDFLRYRHREVMLIQVLTPGELRPGYSGKIRLLDSEAKEDMDERNLKMKVTRGAYKAYEEALTDYLTDIRTFCQSRQAGYLLIETGQDISKALLKSLHEKEVIR